MIETNDLNINDLQQPVSSNKKDIFSKSIIVLLLFLVFGLFINSWQLWGQKDINQKISSDTKDSNEIVSVSDEDDTVSNVISFPEFKLSSEVEAFGFPLEDKLYVSTIPKEGASSEVSMLEDGITHSTITVIKGSSSISSSPNNQLIAYLTNENQLVLMTADQEYKAYLPSNFKVSSLSWWSPDSKRLLVSVADQSTNIESEYPGDKRTLIEYDRNQLSGGFYVVDLSNFSFYRLPLTSNIINWQTVLGWVGNEKLLVALGKDYEHLSFFNVDTFALERQNIVPDGLDIFSLQLTFNEIGDKWAYDLWVSGGDNTMFIDNFPSFEGQVVSIGIQSQAPYISPDGTKVIYQDRGELNGAWSTYLWKNGTSVRSSEGIPVRWVDNDRYISIETEPVYSTNYSSHASKIYMFDLNTQEKTILFDRSSDK